LVYLLPLISWSSATTPLTGNSLIIRKP
jgi:hypothetical protein